MERQNLKQHTNVGYTNDLKQIVKICEQYASDDDSMFNHQSQSTSYTVIFSQ